jgi:NAD(P)-dependent dehydrogenase (short-subunit alcohol dehydrogenase family)
MELAGSVAVVTGGASGLGQATAAMLRGGGARVALLDLSAGAGERAARDLGVGAIFVRTDVTSEDDVTRALDQAGAMGPIRVLVNCAGISRPGRTLGRGGPLPLAEFTAAVTINLVGTFNVIRLAAERMSAAPLAGEERGVIVNTASIAAFDGQVGQAAYAASKAGIAGMTLPLARDLSVRAIRVVTIAPGSFRTPMFDTLPQEIIDSLSAQVPHPARLGEPAEYAALVGHIIANPMLNGETIRLDGALRMGPR